MTRRRDPAPTEPEAPAPLSRRRLTVVAPNASPEEAAAIVAAIERFIADTAPAPPPPAPSTPGGWLRTALVEGVRRGDRRGGGWGDPHP